ncbi:hypothetical protein EXIGLDRAFT_716194 [Exidia glandulosa HHB12029]|uniref:TERF2-interacting telomeric protein 1 Myb domain-containing protein n=1 Tax=Exidia glandulosa HHB12029 TaxID=1314781 RepID=A0A165QX90_EXIGL|nr:hypothetical protein EXIGLDRAFT_716194 [Exidia glandulosa HHB12029]
MSVFTGDNDEPAKFFIQGDLQPEVVDTLTSDITEHGGRVIDKIPLRGFVLVDPNSESGLRLIANWRNPDKPHRRVLPTTFVSACINFGGILPAIFTTVANVPLRMHLHASIQDQVARERAYKRIWHSGGDPTASIEDAEVIIVSDGNDTLADVRAAYARRPAIRVEPLSWIKRCANNGECRFSDVPAPAARRRTKTQNKSGRNEFSADDDYKLIVYLAENNLDNRGRKGNALYKDLCNNLVTYPWAKRHPWSSWRERYIKKCDMFDPKIAKYRQQNGIDDQPNPSPPRRVKKRKVALSDEESVNEVDSDEGDDPAPTLRAAAKPKAKVEYDDEPERPPGGRAKSASRPPEGEEDLAEVRESTPGKPLAEQDSWGSEWNIRVAADEERRPEWAKHGRKRASPGAVDESPAKRARLNAEKKRSSSNVHSSGSRKSPPSASSSRNGQAESVTENSSVGEVEQLADAVADDAGLAEDDPDIGPETQQLLDAHHTALFKPRAASPPPVAGPSSPAVDIQERLDAVAKKNRFWLEDVRDFYERTRDLSATELTFRNMREAADRVMHAAEP